MSPELAAFLDGDPEIVPLVRLFHLNFDTVEYFLNETEVPMTFGGQVWQPCYGWISADPVSITTNPFDANPAYYNVWNVGTREGSQLADEALNNQQVWSDKVVRQIWAVKDYPEDLIVIHTGKIVDVRVRESVSESVIRIRAETIAAQRNYTPLGEYTDRDQQRRHPGDLGCQYAASLVGKKIKGWLRG